MNDDERALAQIPVQALDLLTDDDVRALMHEPVLCVFLNRTGNEPDISDFDGLADKDLDERKAMYGPEGIPRWQRSGRHQQLLLTDGSGEDPEFAPQRIAMVPMDRRIKHHRDGTRGDPMLRADVVWERLGWVTHLALGTRKHGMLAVLELHQPIPVKPGNRFKMSIKLTDLIPPQSVQDLHVLPAAPHLLTGAALMGDQAQQQELVNAYKQAFNASSSQAGGHRQVPQDDEIRQKLQSSGINTRERAEQQARQDAGQPQHTR